MSAWGTPDYLGIVRQAEARLMSEGKIRGQPGPSPANDLPRLLGMPLDQFAREGQPVEIRVPWWPETLLFVPDRTHAEALWRDGIARERIWTAGELISMLGHRRWTPDALRIVMLVRREFEGEVVGARPRLVGSA